MNIKPRRVVYTALFGDYDVLQEPICSDSDCHFICFTDQKYITSEKWEVIYIDDVRFGATLANRKYKMFPHEYLSDYHESLYVDANILLRGNIDELFQRYLVEGDIVVPTHYARDCIFDEAEVVLRSGRIKLWPTLKQMYCYRKNGYQPHFGLGENNIILRKHNAAVAKLMSKWWIELNKYEPRDQFSLCYLCWLSSTPKLLFMEENARGAGSTYFVASPHSKRINSLYLKLFSFLFRYVPFCVFNRVFLKSFW